MRHCESLRSKETVLVLSLKSETDCARTRPPTLLHSLQCHDRECEHNNGQMRYARVHADHERHAHMPLVIGTHGRASVRSSPVKHAAKAGDGIALLRPC